jgi:hypothetical protein
MGAEAIYVAEVSDGYRTVRARGATSEVAIEKARKDWEASRHPK